MQITINDSTVTVPEYCTVAQALQSYNITFSGIAVAVNNKVVPLAKLDTTPLHSGDSIIIIQAFYGG
ncbi:MAG: sulfur carrier protein ThiS [Paramuribaculum sp.]|nr:sulfur carrier protein ThiS [Paramuribaculum sp.]